MSKVWNSEKIHWRIGQRNLCNFSAKSPDKGWIKFYDELHYLLNVYKFQSKRVQNPQQNGWEVSYTRAIISSNGLLASDSTGAWQNVFAKKGFPITGELSRIDKFPGTILYYFEITIMLSPNQ
jgi:hypothetical protein